MLERQKKLIEAGRVKELSAADVYRWGLRFLYGVDGIGVNLKVARELFNLSEQRGIKSASAHQKFCSEIHELQQQLNQYLF